jgi:hypothetical protein
MNKLNFKEFLELSEVSTSTADVATFSLPIGGLFTRKFPQFYSVGDHGLAGPVSDLMASNTIPKNKRKKRS